MASANEIVKEIMAEYGLECDNNQAGCIAWNETGYPEFWSIPKNGQTWEECFRTQIRRYAEKVIEHRKLEVSK